MRTWLNAAAALALLALGCANEKSETVQGPPVVVALRDAAPPGALTAQTPPVAEPSDAATTAAGPDAAAPPPASESPVVAQFVDATPTGAKVDVDACDSVLVSVVKGNVDALGERLKKGDVLVASRTSTLTLKGTGLALLARVVHPGCAKTEGGVSKRVVRAGAAPELALAKGALRVHLDVEKDVSPEAYLGRMEGTAPVPENVHPASWEILCAVDAAGTFTIDGKAQRLAPRGIVIVPPNVKHAWQPDEGSSLSAVQIYAPPGPEQRFKALAAAATDGGTSGPAAK